MARLRSTLSAPLAALLAALGLAACASHPPLPTEPYVDLEAFMGDWYVHGQVPASSEKDGYNGVESYALRGGNKVLTTYAFRDGGFDGPVEVMNPTGRVKDDGTNAEWSMRFYWLFAAEYLIAYLSEDGKDTIIARTKRDYAWIMSRDPEIADERYDALVARVVALGYPPEKIRRMPQRWPDPGHPLTAAAPRSLAEATRGEGD